MRILKLQLACLLLLATVSCSRAGREMGEVVGDMAPKVVRKSSDSIAGNADALASGLKGFIKQAGKNEGAAYIEQSLNTDGLIDGETLFQVIVNGMLKEAELTGEYVAQKQIREEAYAIAGTLISEYQLETEESPDAAE